MALALPVDEILPALRAALAAHGAVVLEAPPGAGKTTRVPAALLADVPGEIWVLEPRRLAARLAATRVADELGEPLGGTVGYRVRYEDVGGPKTRLRFVTEGLLTRRLVGDPELRGIGAVILDEFHERHLPGDLALALLARLRRTSRPELKLVVMSATLDAAPVAAFLGDCPRLRAEGRRFDVAIEHAAQDGELPLERQVAGAVKRAIVEDAAGGDVLVFLPGGAEIARATSALAELAARHDLLVVPLHGELPPAEQDRAVKPASRRKVILSTNVAETSVTIEGVGVVVDAGLARVASHSPWSGLPSLRVQKISQASATQRAGRAGRTRAGRCLRLYTRHDHDARPAYDAPEIRRADLAELCLSLHAAGVARAAELAWFEAPTPAAISAAEGLLARLGAVDGEGALTPLGRRVLAFPLHPRLGRLIAAGEARGVAEDACVIAAALSERSRGRGKPGAPRREVVAGPSDVLDALERFRAEPRAHPEIDRARRQLERLLKRGSAPAPRDPDGELLQAVLAAFPDRVARRRKPGGRDVVLAGGGAAELAEDSVVRDAELMVVVDVEDRGVAGQAASGKPRVTRASAIEADWLIDVDLDGSHLVDAVTLRWNASQERVERVERLTYDQLTLSESVGAPREGDAAQAGQVLAQAALAAGVARFGGGDGGAALATWRTRLALVAKHVPDAGVAMPDDAHLTAALAARCEGAASFAELGEAPLLDALLAALPANVRRSIDDLVPEHVTLMAGRRVRVTYEDDKPPWIASRMQDFFGMAKGPVLCRGRVPVTLHLLAPNQRAVQVTSDLAGFWERHYPQIRKELMRRYPRHKWPESPLTPTD